MPEQEKVKEGMQRKGFKMSEFVKKLQSGEMSPDTLGKEELQKVAWYLKDRGCSYSDIAETVDRDERTVRRYIRDERDGMCALEIGAKFQRDVIMDYVYGSNAQYQNLLKVLNQDELTPKEKIEIILRMHQILQHKLETLSKLGCFGNPNAILTVLETYKETADSLKDAWAREYEALTPAELTSILTILFKNKDGLMATCGKMLGELNRVNEVIETPPAQEGEGK